MSLINHRHDILERWNKHPTLIRWSWGLYAMCGLYSLVRGLLHYPMLSAARDFALCYYSVLIFLAAGIDWTDEKVHKFLRVLRMLIVLKAFFILYRHLVYFIAIGESLRGQPAAESLILALGLLFWILSDSSPQWMSVTTYLSSVTILAAILTLLVRSAWTGLVAGLIVAFLGLLRQERPSGVIRRAILVAISLSAGVVLVLKLVSYSQYLYDYFTWQHPPTIFVEPSPSASTDAEPGRIGDLTKRKIRADPVISKVTTGDLIVDPSQPPQSDLSSEDSTPSTVAKAVPALVPPAPPAVVLPVTQAPPKTPGASVLDSRIKDELLSLFKGRKSANVQTRLWFWRDALSEVLCVGLFSPTLQASEFSRFNIPKDPKPIGNNTYILPIFGTGFEKTYLAIRTYPDSNGKWSVRDILKSVHQTLFGIPFGKPFLPPEAVWLINSPYRYDPHNSFIAIFYRMGLLGIVSFAILSGTILRAGWKRFKISTSTERNACLTMVCGGVCFLVHSLTDNTLENAFKGIWYWSILGLAYGLSRRTLSQNYYNKTKI